MSKKLLYITANSKPEHLSSSKTVARMFINDFLKEYQEFEIEEIDLYNDHIPRLEYQYFADRNCLIDEEAASKLNEHDQKEVRRIRELCDQFISADVYVIAAPMWSLSFPAPLKEYIDCIVQVGKTIYFGDSKRPKGLLNDKVRNLIYIQSSGGNINWMVDPIMDMGENYVSIIMKTIGIKKVIEIKVDGTGKTEDERKNAINEAKEKVNSVVRNIKIN